MTQATSHINQPAARVKIHERDSRGQTKTGWLDSKHTFSFGGFRDPSRVRFRSLRVINDDIIAPGSGFGTHPHENMEIITYVLKGALEHKDSMGNGSVIQAGDFQYMSAGSGVTHSEFNHHSDQSAHLYQIWIMPNQKNAPPLYRDLSLSDDIIGQEFYVVADAEGGEDRIQIRQDAKIAVARPKEGAEIIYNLEEGRGAFLQILRGEVMFDDEVLREGDGIQIEGVETITLHSKVDSEIMLFDLN